MPAQHKPEAGRLRALSSLRATGRVNPLPGLLGRENAVYSGTNTHYSTGEVGGWLSIKTVLSGSVVWETRERPASRRFTFIAPSTGRLTARRMST